MFCALLLQLFVEEEIATKGVPVHFPGGQSAVLFFRMGNFLLDGDGIRMMYGCKGGRPKLPCVACLNVTTDQSMVGAGMVALTCRDSSLFELATDEDLWLKADRLHAAAAKHREKLSTSFGLNYVPEGFLWSKPLRRFVSPTGSLTFDAMHVLLADGVVAREYEVLLPRLLEEGMKWNDFHEYTSINWRRGRSQCRSKHSFNKSIENHFRSTGTFSLPASQNLDLLPIFLNFLETIALKRCPGRLDKEVDSFRALSAVVNLVKQSKTLGAHDASRLRDACRVRAEAFAVAYPDFPETTHKAHWLHHLPSQLARDGFILDCFTGERNHARLKAVATSIKNTSQYEKTCLLRLLGTQISALESSRRLEASALVNPKPCPQYGGFVSLHLLYHGTQFSKNDIVMLDNEFRCISGFWSVDGATYTIAWKMHIQEQITASAFRCTLGGDLVYFDSSRRMRATIWCWQARDVIVLIP